MTSSADDGDCLFCQVVSVLWKRLRWFDRPLIHAPGIGGVIAGLGAFVPGYVLVFPEQHIESVLQVPRELATPFSDLLQRTVDAVRSTFGPPTLFEHGSCSRKDARRSACLDHAHVHVLPRSYGLNSHVPEPVDDALGVSDSKALECSGYLFLQEPMTKPIYGPDPGVSQFFRRHIARALGMDDAWDYLLFPRMENVSETISHLKEVLELTWPAAAGQG
jgi:diadenosine tetraphosphate (Ap4A) HIT family hydrolase